LFIWATWKIRLIRIPMVTANLLMLVATPITGGHYLVDLAAGAVVMLAAVTITRKALRLDARHPSHSHLAERHGS